MFDRNDASSEHSSAEPGRAGSPGAVPSREWEPVSPDLRAYLAEVGRTSLLTADEERELGWRMINDGCAESRRRFVRANLGLVICIADNYCGRGLNLAALIGHGNVGLSHAVDGFDPARGARFSFLASWWIKQAMKRAILNLTPA